ncbi:MAG: hypothetical protein JOZ68_13075 [Acidimicrobiia bacterium]|nr:hypothetical protein [Acidimicrobiia bacterium]MBV8985122.1 hypothetical protein [Acidimicrobiia bacterium]MBV9041934.1 hypothetical protein [Acidimicrobiia bacterium]
MTGAALAACGGGSDSPTIAGKSTTGPTVTPPHLEVNTGPAPWPRPDDAIQRVAAAGLPAFKSEQLFYHVHAHLDVYVDGHATVVPAGLGIGGDPNAVVQTQNGQLVAGLVGGKCSQPCISPLHTHDESGVLHVENDKERQINLGQLFTEWGVRFTTDCVGSYCAPDKPYKVYVNGQPFTGDASTVVLKNLEEIAVVIGTPPATIPNAFPSS